jgi:hypothetical protein
LRILTLIELLIKGALVAAKAWVSLYSFEELLSIQGASTKFA